MEQQISKPFLYLATTKDIWDTNQKLYSKHHYASRLDTLQKQVHECKQGTMDVTSFFNTLIWLEIDLYREIVWNCPSDGIQYFRIVGYKWVFTLKYRANNTFET